MTDEHDDHNLAPPRERRVVTAQKRARAAVALILRVDDPQPHLEAALRRRGPVVRFPSLAHFCTARSATERWALIVIARPCAWDARLDDYVRDRRQLALFGEATEREWPVGVERLGSLDEATSWLDALDALDTASAPKAHRPPPGPSPSSLARALQSHQRATRASERVQAADARRQQAAIAADARKVERAQAKAALKSAPARKAKQSLEPEDASAVQQELIAPGMFLVIGEDHQVAAPLVAILRRGRAVRFARSFRDVPESWRDPTLWTGVVGLNALESECVAIARHPSVCAVWRARASQDNPEEFRQLNDEMSALAWLSYARAFEHTGHPDLALAVERAITARHLPQRHAEVLAVATRFKEGRDRARVLGMTLESARSASRDFAKDASGTKLGECAQQLLDACDLTVSPHALWAPTTRIREQWATSWAELRERVPDMWRGRAISSAPRVAGFNLLVDTASRLSVVTFDDLVRLESDVIPEQWNTPGAHLRGLEEIFHHAPAVGEPLPPRELGRLMVSPVLEVARTPAEGVPPGVAELAETADTGSVRRPRPSLSSSAHAASKAVAKPPIVPASRRALAPSRGMVEWSVGDETPTIYGGLERSGRDRERLEAQQVVASAPAEPELADEAYPAAQLDEPDVDQSKVAEKVDDEVAALVVGLVDGEPGDAGEETETQAVPGFDPVRADNLPVPIPAAIDEPNVLSVSIEPSVYEGAVLVLGSTPDVARTAARLRTLVRPRVVVVASGWESIASDDCAALTWTGIVVMDPSIPLEAVAPLARHPSTILPWVSDPAELTTVANAATVEGDAAGEPADKLARWAAYIVAFEHTASVALSRALEKLAVSARLTAALAEIAALSARLLPGRAYLRLLDITQNTFKTQVRLLLGRTKHGSLRDLGMDLIGQAGAAPLGSAAWIPTARATRETRNTVWQQFCDQVPAAWRDAPLIELDAGVASARGLFAFAVDRAVATVGELAELDASEVPLELCNAHRLTALLRRFSTTMPTTTAPLDLGTSCLDLLSAMAFTFPDPWRSALIRALERDEGESDVAANLDFARSVLPAASRLRCYGKLIARVQERLAGVLASDPMTLGELAVRDPYFAGLERKPQALELLMRQLGVGVFVLERQAQRMALYRISLARPYAIEESAPLASTATAHRSDPAAADPGAWDGLGSQVPEPVRALDVADADLPPALREFARRARVRTVGELFDHPALAQARLPLRTARTLIHELTILVLDNPAERELAGGSSLLEAFEQRLSFLAPEAREIVVARSGLVAAPVTLKDLARARGVSVEGVRQAEKTAMISLCASGWRAAVRGRIARAVASGEVSSRTLADERWFGGLGPESARHVLEFLCKWVFDDATRPHFDDLEGPDVPGVP